MTLHLCDLRGAAVVPKTHRLHIQACPAPWMIGATTGSVPVLAPQGQEAILMRLLVKDRQMSRPLNVEGIAAYRALYTARILGLAKAGALDPGFLQDDQQSPIEQTVALICSCSVADAAAGRCHRAWAAEVLAKRGTWDVVLDGVPYGSVLTPQGELEAALLSAANPNQ